MYRSGFVYLWLSAGADRRGACSPPTLSELLACDAPTRNLEQPSLMDRNDGLRDADLLCANDGERRGRGRGTDAPLGESEFRPLRLLSLSWLALILNAIDLDVDMLRCCFFFGGLVLPCCLWMLSRERCRRLRGTAAGPDFSDSARPSTIDGCRRDRRCRWPCLINCSLFADIILLWFCSGEWSVESAFSIVTARRRFGLAVRGSVAVSGVITLCFVSVLSMSPKSRNETCEIGLLKGVG